MSTSDILPIRVHKGRTFSLQLTVKVNDVAIDITGWKFAGEIRPYVGGDLVGSFTFEEVTPVSGRVNANISKTATAAITEVGKGFFYEIVRDDGSGEEIRLFGGPCEIVGQLTEATPELPA